MYLVISQLLLIISIEVVMFIPVVFQHISVSFPIPARVAVKIVSVATFIALEVMEILFAIEFLGLEIGVDLSCRRLMNAI